MTKEKLDITELGEITYNVEQARNLLLVLSDVLENIQPKNNSFQLADHEEVIRLASETYRGFDNWTTLLDTATLKLNDQIKRLDNAQ